MKKLPIAFSISVALTSGALAQDIIMETGFEDGELVPGTVQILPVQQPNTFVSQGQINVILYRGTIRNALLVQFNLNMMGFVIVSNGPLTTNPFNGFRLVFRPSNYVVNLTGGCPELTCIDFSQQGMVGMAPMVDQDFEVVANVGSTSSFVGHNYMIGIYSIIGQSVPTTNFAFSGLPGPVSRIIIQ